MAHTMGSVKTHREMTRTAPKFHLERIQTEKAPYKELLAVGFWSDKELPKVHVKVDAGPKHTPCYFLNSLN